MSVCLYTGKDTFRKESSLKQRLYNHGLRKDQIIVYEGSDKHFQVETALIECEAFSLFAEENHKAVIIKDPYFLQTSYKSSETKDKDRLAEMLKSYFTHQNPDTELIFYCVSFDADARKKEYKLIKQYGEIIDFKPMKEYEFARYARTQLQDNRINIDADGFNELLLRVNNSTFDLYNAIEKIQLYGSDNLTLEDIRHLVSLNPEVNAFRMADSFLKGNLNAVIRSKDEMLEGGYSYNTLISMMANKIRTAYYMKLLYERGLTNEMIANRLKANPYAVKFSLEASYGLSADDMLAYLDQLAIIDQGIKDGTMIAKEAFDMFLLRNGRRKSV